MNKKIAKKALCTFLSILLILSAFAVTPVLASVTNGNLAADMFDDHTDSSSLPSYWALNGGDASAVTVQNGAISINNAEASDAVSVNVYSPDEAGSRKLTTQLYKNSLIEFKARKNSDVTTYFEMCGGSKYATMFRISFEANGCVQVHNCRTTADGPNGSYKLANVYNLNEFFTVKVHVVSGTGNRLISVWVNDKLVVDGAHFNATSIISVKTGRFVVPAKTDDTSVNFEVADYFVRNLDVQSNLNDLLATDAAEELLTLRDLLGKNSVASIITSDLTLPSGVGVVNALPGEDGAFTNDVAIQWASDNEAVINPQTGAVVRPRAGEADVNVKLTATLTKGEAEAVNEEFNFVVKAKTREEITALDNGNLVADMFDDHTDSSSLPSYWALNGGDASAVTVQNGAISINNAEAFDAVSVNVYSPDEAGSRKLTTQLYENSLIEFKARKNSDVTTYFEMCGGSKNDTMFRISFEANGCVQVHNCRTTADGPNGSYKLANVYNLNEFFTVKVHVVSGKGNRLISVWVNDKLVVDGAHFNASTIISVKTGRFVVPAKTDDTSVNFEVADYFVRNLDVQSNLNDLLATDAAEELLTLRDLLGKNSVASIITSDLTLPSGVGVVNALPGEDGAFTNDVAIQWASDNEAVINPQTGAVTVPEIGEEPVNVKLTATLTKGEAESVSEEFDFVVKNPWTYGTDSEGNITLTSADEYALTGNNAISVKTGIDFEESEGISFNIGGNNTVDFRYDNDGNFSYTDANGETVTNKVDLPETSSLELVTYSNNTAALLVNGDIVFENIPVANASALDGNVAVTFLSTADEAQNFDASKYESLTVSSHPLYKLSEDDVTVAPGSVSINTEGFYAPYGTDMYAAVFSNGEITELLNVATLDAQKTGSTLSANLENAGAEGTTVKVFVWNGSDPILLPIIK